MWWCSVSGWLERRRGGGKKEVILDDYVEEFEPRPSQKCLAAEVIDRCDNDH